VQLPPEQVRTQTLTAVRFFWSPFSGQVNGSEAWTNTQLPPERAERHADLPGWYAGVQTMRNPATATVLAALRRLAGRAGIELTVLAGNHDPELLIDDVRDEFAARIGRTRGANRWADDEALVRGTASTRRAGGERLPVLTYGAGCTVGGSGSLGSGWRGWRW
jgi:hypothetical protein